MATTVECLFDNPSIRDLRVVAYRRPKVSERSGGGFFF